MQQGLSFCLFDNNAAINVLVICSQAFSDYQLQQMTSNFIDQFGFNEEEFAEQEEKIE